MARLVSLSAYILSTVSPSCKHEVKKIQPTARNELYCGGAEGLNPRAF